MLETIKINSNGDLVKVAQYLTGFSKLKKANGEYDSSFEKHVSSWQTKHGLTADGIIGSQTWIVIAQNAPTCSTSKNKTSAASCAVQIIIGGLIVDGIYGSQTKKAVSAYQSANGLVADGICGPKTWAQLLTGTSTPASTPSGSGSGSEAVIEGQTTPGKVINRCVHYLQWDSRWKNVKYSTHTSKQTIGNSGCGPTAMAQIMATFIDPTITPVEMCALAVANGFRTYNNGTTWDFFEFIFKKYKGFSKFLKTNSIETVKAGLATGALAVGSMNSGDNCFWTKGGHFITIIGYDSDGYIYANDPNKKEAPRKQKQNKFKSCMKQAFLFWPEIKESKQGAVDGTSDTGTTLHEAIDSQGNKHIVDISKWQDNIDFDSLKSKVALVIARASCGSDKDVKFDSYATTMNQLGIPFGVYCYSYAGTEEKARDEAAKLVKYASKYKPLFYVLDAEEAKLSNTTIAVFADELCKQGAKRIGCYVAHHRYNDYKYDSLRNLFDFTWIPRYGKDDGTIGNSIKPAYMCDLWQYTSKGKIAGINGNADLNYVTGDGKSLNWFLGKE